MKKTFYLISICLSLLFFWCAIERSNPLDEEGENFIPPSILVDTSRSLIQAYDTIHQDTGKIILIGNRPESMFQIQINNGAWSAWQKSGEFTLRNLQEGSNVVYINSKYDGGFITTQDSIIFFVVFDNVKPKFTLFSDTIILKDTGATFTIIASANGKLPITYQWIKDKSIVSEKISDTLTFLKLTLRDTGEYRCIAKNQYGTDTSKIYKIQIQQSQVDTNHYKVTIDATKGGKVTRNRNDSTFLANELLFLKAIADSGYEFDYWDGDVKSDFDTLSIKITKNSSVRAVFSPIISGSCKEVAFGENLSVAIRNVISTNKQGILCVRDGKYNGRAIKINGKIKIIIK